MKRESPYKIGLSCFIILRVAPLSLPDIELLPGFSELRA
jgi:hypothetical protein